MIDRTIKFSRKKFPWNINKIFILPWAKHPGKSYRSRHNRSCQGLTKIKTLENEAQRPKPKTHSKKKRSREKDANMWFPPSCQCSHPIMSSTAHKMHCWKSCLVLWFLSVSEFPGYYWLCYSVCLFFFLGFRYISYTQLIAEIDGINFVFLFSTFCQPSCLRMQ